MKSGPTAQVFDTANDVASADLPRLIIRADADETIGTGHLMRCLALADIWCTQGGSAWFVTATSSERLLDRLAAVGCRMVPLPGGVGRVSQSRCLEALVALRRPNSQVSDWVVLDGYTFGPTLQSSLRRAGFRVLCIDDMAHHAWYDATAILNQNLNASELSYRCPRETRLLLGTEYVLLRRELRDGISRAPQPLSARRILVTLGGSDPANVTATVVRALAHADLELRVVAGGANPHQHELRRLAERLPSVELFVDVRTMAPLLSWADLAICAGGTTCWELAFAAKPLCVVVIADNQWGNANALAERGVAKCLGWHEQLTEGTVRTETMVLARDVSVRTSMAERAAELVDGRGGDRVVAYLRGN